MSKIDQSLSGWIKTPESERLQREYEHACATTNTAAWTSEEVEAWQRSWRERIEAAYHSPLGASLRQPQPEGVSCGLHKAIQEAMAKETHRIIEEEAQQASKRTEERVRALASQIATRVASWTEFERRGTTLTIRVETPQKERA